MAATITIHVYTGASGGTVSGSVTGIDLISADNASNTLANRVANPISACSSSYEKYISACITAPPTNNVSNFQLWGDEAVMTGTCLLYGFTTQASLPGATTSSVATIDFTTAASTAKAAWDTASYAATGCAIQFAVFQLRAFTAASAGNWTQETIYYSYDEV